MGVSKQSGALRIVTGLGLVAFAIAAGALQRSPWLLPFLGAGFTSAYLFGQLRSWRRARNTGTLRRYWLQIPADFAVQLGLVSVLYLIGFGLGALVSGRVAIAPFAPGDVIWPLAIGVLGAIFGLMIDRMEGHPSTLIPAWLNTGDDAAEAPRADFRMLPDPVTVDNFFAPPSGEAPDEPGCSEDDITRAEARLGRALPDLLIALYRLRNGGSVNYLCIPKPGHEETTYYNHVFMPFSGYDELTPASRLRTVWESVTDYADPDNPDDADQFPPGAKAMVILAQWYRETLFLDYNQPGAPRVGFSDFDRFDTEGNRDPITWWKDFDTFFAALRIYETN
jgi:hypothetical protein